MRHGLTLGKFAPFHKGHQYLIETSLLSVDALTVVIYDSPEITSVPLPVRANWIRSLYPQVEVIEAWDGPSEVGDTPEIRKMHEDYIIERLGVQGVTHFFSNEFYGAHMSAALGAINCQIDPSRNRFPISGTLIRQNPYLYREYLEPSVYRDLVANVVFLGAPSTGKTTLAARMAQELKTSWMPEYGREYWELHQVDRRLSLDQLVEIAEGHLIREEALLYAADRYLFTDTNALTTYIFSLYYHGNAHSRLVELAAQAASRYDLIFLCDTDIPYDDTWDRSGKVNRETLQKRIVSDLTMRKLPYFVLRGSLEERVASVKAVLDRHPKYTNPIYPVTR